MKGKAEKRRMKESKRKERLSIIRMTRKKGKGKEGVKKDRQNGRSKEGDSKGGGIEVETERKWVGGKT